MGTKRSKRGQRAAAARRPVTRGVLTRSDLTAMGQAVALGVRAGMAKGSSNPAPRTPAVDPTRRRAPATGHARGVARGGEGYELPEGHTFHEGNTRPAPVPKGIRWVRLVKARAAAHADHVPVTDVLKSQGYKFEADAVRRTTERRSAVARALGQSTFAGGGALVPDEFAQEVIELLRAQTVVRASGPRIIEMGASLTIPKQTAGAVASYGYENRDATPTEPAYGAVKLAERKLTTLCPIPNDLIRNATLGVEDLVLQDLLAAMREAEDSAFLFGSGDEFTPRGIENQIDPTHAYAGTATDPINPTLAEVRKEIARAVGKLKRAKIPMSRLGWISSPRVEEFLMGIVDGNGNAIYEAELSGNNPTLRRIAWKGSMQIPENLGGTGDESRLLLVDWAQVLIGDSMGMEVAVADGGAYQLPGGQVVSGFSRDQTVMRVISKHDIGMRHPKAGVSVRVRWAAGT